METIEYEMGDRISAGLGSAGRGAFGYRLPIRELTLLPIQPVDNAELEQIVRALRARKVDPHVKPPVLRPRDSYDADRRQLRADVLLQRVLLAEERPVLGITDADCYAGKLNFVFGIAAMAGAAAVVSLFRLHTRASANTFIERAMKEIFHELGHAMGLAHCANPRCVMHFSNSLAETDMKEERLCATCARRLRGASASPRDRSRPH